MKRIAFVAALLIVCALMLCACGGINTAGIGQPVEDQPYKSITAEEALELIGKDGVMLIDVRSEDEFATGYILGAVNMPLAALGTAADGISSDKNTVIIVYCQSGGRSAKAARLIGNAGYKNVFDLGGIESWTYDIAID